MLQNGMRHDSIEKLSRPIYDVKKNFTFLTIFFCHFIFRMQVGKSTPRLDSAKLKALRLIKMKGPLKASDPNKVITKADTPELQERVRKRALNQSDEKVDPVEEERASKRSKMLLDSMLEAKSSHSHLVDELEVTTILMPFQFFVLLSILASSVN